MKIEDIKIGMKVRIRQWDDMEREYGLNRRGDISVNVKFSFTGDMRRFCGVCMEVVSINNNIIELSKKFGNSWGGNYSISADMLEPVVEEFTMPPPPDLGELHGVKLPAWMWSRTDKKRVYLLRMQIDFGLYPAVVDGKLRHLTDTFLEPYTGQDMPPKPSVDELKSLARLV